MTEHATLGIRDRKRIRTRAQIEDAALFLVLRDGLEATTIDAISARADISSRTFFNYFDSKDSAVLGLHQEDPEAEEIALEPGESIVEAVVRLVLETMGGSLESLATVQQDRVEVIRRHPEVLGGQMSALHARADRMHRSIELLLAASPDFADDSQRTARAEILLGLAGTALKAAVRDWAGASADEPATTIHQRAVALINDTTRKLS